MLAVQRHGKSKNMNFAKADREGMINREECLYG